MNALFFIVFVVATASLLLLAPKNFLPTLLQGATKSASLCFALVSTYAVWLGLMQVWQDSGVTRFVSKITKPLVQKLFRTNDAQTLDALCMNTSVNLLGISGAGTPYGVLSAKLLDGTENAEYASAMLFVVNATSIQLIPTSVIGVRTALGSVAPADIILPTLLTTLFSTVLAVCLVLLLFPTAKREKNTPKFSVRNIYTRGADI